MRLVTKALVVVLLILPLAVPALAGTYEHGSKSCSASAHVYTKGRWRYDYHSYLDKLPPDGTKDKQVTLSSSSGSFFSTYLNTFSVGGVNIDINSAYYYIWGEELSLAQSWPGCESDS